MLEPKEFCSCGDTKCPNHPSNHDKGCDLCIQKNLRCGEIPSCFFHAVGMDEKVKAYCYKDFADLVLRKLEVTE